MSFLWVVLFFGRIAVAQEVPSACKSWLDIEARDARLGPGVDSIDLSCINKSGTRAAFHGTAGESIQYLMTITHRRGGASMEFSKEGPQYRLSISLPTLDGRTQAKEILLDGECNPIEITWAWRDERTPYRRMDRKECLRKPRDVFEEHSETYKSLQYYCGLYELKAERPASVGAAGTVPAASPSTTPAAE